MFSPRIPNLGGEFVVPGSQGGDSQDLGTRCERACNCAYRMRARAPSFVGALIKTNDTEINVCTEIYTNNAIDAHTHANNSTSNDTYLPAHILACTYASQSFVWHGTAWHSFGITLRYAKLSDATLHCTALHCTAQHRTVRCVASHYVALRERLLLRRAA